jgi:hypothetical protein
MEVSMRRRRADEDVFDEDGVLKDGATYTVPLWCLDATRRQITEAFDADNHRPHYARATTDAAAEQRRAAAYAAYVQRLTSAWRSPAASAERNEAQLEAWRRPGARPGLRSQDAATDRAAAYAAYVQRIQNAWRAA